MKAFDNNLSRYKMKVLGKDSGVETEGKLKFWV